MNIDKRIADTGKRRCPTCGKDNPITYKFCFGCGYSIPDFGSTSQERSIPELKKEENNPQQQKKSFTPNVRKKRYGWWILVFAIGTLFIYTNPDEKIHVDFVKDRFNQEIKKNPSFLGSPVDKKALIVDKDEINDFLKIQTIKRINCIFFSITEIQSEDNAEYEPIGFGVLGNIFELGTIVSQMDLLATHVKQLTPLTHNYEGVYKCDVFKDQPNNLFSAIVEKKEKDVYIITFDIGFVKGKYRGYIENDNLVFYIDDGQTIEIKDDSFEFVFMKYYKVK